MSNLIIDVTELVQWEGKLTGVPRVMNELSLRYSELPGVIFVTWDASLHYYERTNLIDELTNKSVSFNDSSVLETTRHSKLINAALKVRQKSKLTSKVLFIPEKIIKQVILPIPQLTEKEIINPKSGDLLFVLADWHGADHVFVDRLVKLKDDGVKLAQISYDMLPVIAPQFSGHATKTFTNYIKRIYPICDLILTISEHTKMDITSWLDQNNLNVPRIETFRLGDDFKIAKPKKPTNTKFLDNYEKETDFILNVGTIEARKNHTLLYYTYKLACQRKIVLPNIVVVGRRGWLTNDIYEIITNDPDIKNKFIFLENTTDEELAWLYKNCLFSIYPSFYEGWGLPIAESLIYGVPCISSNSSSMPEISGEIINYFSPYSSEDCLKSIVYMLKSANIDSIRSKISQYKPVSWDQTYYNVNKIIGEISD